MNQDIIEFAEQMGVDPSTVDFMANHIMATMGAAMLEEESEAVQVEMMRAGVESIRRVMQSLTTKAMTRSGGFAAAVYDELSRRAES